MSPYDVKCGWKERADELSASLVVVAQERDAAKAELELLRRNEQLAANFAARADEVRKAAEVVARTKHSSPLAFRAAVSLLLTAVLGPEVWRDGEIARDGTQALTINEEET